MTLKKVYKLGYLRTHVCGEVSDLPDGESVCLAGWVDRIRELGGLTFIDLIDRFGSVQCVLDKSHTQPNISRYDVVRVEGVVKKRPEQNIQSGKSSNEVQDAKVKILHDTEPLPFSTDKGKSTEQTRLKYRYLDLRRPEMWRRLKLKSDLYQFTRRFFTERQFLEIETPKLYKTTPEGARDYLVPSRLYPGHYYALPQSPQTLKQLLMIGGFDRYMQIVRCFRDEDLRQNRQPEFTQLDIECSFVEQKDVMTLMDEYFLALFKAFEKELFQSKIHHIKYERAMNQYGTDRPDLRYPQVLFGSIQSLFKKFPFKPFENFVGQPRSDIACLGVTQDHISELPSRSKLSKFEKTVKEAGAGGLLWVINDGGEWKSSVKSFFTPEVCEELKKLMGNAAVYFIVGGGQERYGAMDVLRQMVIEQFNVKPKSEFCATWVMDFPLFVQTDDGHLTPSHHPFSAPDPEWAERMLKEDLSQDQLLGISSPAYDIVINGEEIGGGSIRIHDSKLQRRIFELLGLEKAEIDEKFGFLIEALSYGTPPHGGIALGMDRLVATLDGHDVIRDYIAFPKTLNAQCLMSGAPSVVSADQLDELGIICK